MVRGWRGAIADILIAGANPAPLGMLERYNGGTKASDWAA